MVMAADVKAFIRFCESTFGKKVMEKEAEYLYDELRSCEKILDVGCGIGTFERNLPTLNIIGLDISEEMLDEARKRSGKTFVQGDATQLQFRDSTLDAVFTVATLEFLDDFRDAIKEMARVTKPDGKIVVMMLNPKSEYFREEVKKPDDYFRRIKHSNLGEMREFLSRFYTITVGNYCLGVRGKQVFDTDEERYSSLYIVAGMRK